MWTISIHLEVLPELAPCGLPRAPTVLAGVSVGSFLSSSPGKDGAQERYELTRWEDEDEADDQMGRVFD